MTPQPVKPSFSLCVYCGSRSGADPAYAQAATDVGAFIGTNGGELVYGGGKSGLMGIVADATLAAGGQVYGVIPRTLEEREVAHRGLTELHVVDTMNVRKQMMIERATAFVALPGGMGTLEELFEVWTLLTLGFQTKPVGVLNINGVFDPLTALLQSLIERDLLGQWQLDALHIGVDTRALLNTLTKPGLSA